jgi:hypothetical protein
MAARVSTLIAALAGAAILIPAGSAQRQDAAPNAIPTLYVMYTMTCTFSIVDDAGRPVNGIAPGTYQVEVVTPIMFKLVEQEGRASNDYTGCKGWVQFQLTGPGVNLSTTLDAGCDAFYLLPATSFKPSSTYNAVDLNQPTVAHDSFTTLASGTPVIPPSPYSATSGKGSTSQDIVGSLLGKTLRGTLTGTLSADGKPSLTSGGRAVSTLKAGRYTFSIVDHSPKTGFTVQQVQSSAKSKPVTGNAFVGKHSVTVTLTAGKWEYYSQPGHASYFTVTS